MIFMYQLSNVTVCEHHLILTVSILFTLFSPSPFLHPPPPFHSRTCFLPHFFFLPPFPLGRENGYLVETERLEAEIRKGADLVVIVNPNNPSGRHVPRASLEEALRRVPQETTVWIDETYVDYVGAGESLEQYAAASRNAVVCKSMSKAYALSGLRVGYLCGPARLIEPLRAATPPWAVSLPAQIAAVKALEDPAYYAARYAETHALRARLADGIEALGGIEAVPGAANFLLCHLSADRPPAEALIAACRERGLFLRNAALTAPLLGDRAVRVAVKDAATNRRMLAIIEEALQQAER